MRKPKMFGIGSLIFLLWLRLTMAADGTFEDADKAKDYTSGNSNQQFDLRHTIPGEPEVDYPIYSEVPNTSFECTGRHEGYYADVESRCQAFRICAHTARSVHGFGFLCPNGTLFSQKNFVCDWYRNVNCDESEQYYSKNDINRVGSSYDMMERVRQMMEYPMKTISKALQRGGSTTARRPATTKAAHHTLKKELHSAAPQTARQNTVSSRGSVRNSQRGSARKQAVTRAQVESVQSYNRKDDGTSSSTRTQQDATRTTNAHDDSTEQRIAGDQSTKTASVEATAADSDTESDDVYVNSLGELSTDPGVSFDRTNAHIIAESPRSYNYGKKLNFAEKVNAALNDLVDLPPTSGDVLAPDYVKNMRKSTDEATQTDLASNINGLLDEIAYELDTNVSGYQVPAPQKTKHAFKFLSRGFSSQSERAKDPSYLYGKPKQTASTIRFSPNELPVEDKDHFEAKTQKHTNETHTNENTNTDSAANAHTFENSEETIQFTIMTTTTPAPADETSVAAIDDSYLSEATLPPLDDYSYLSPPLLDALLPPTTDAIDATEVPPNTAQPYIETTPLAETTLSPEFAAYAVTTTPPPSGYEESTTALATPSDELAAVTDDPKDGDDVNALAELKEQQRNVAKHAAQLLLAGVKLTTLDNGTENVAFAAGLDQHSTGELLIRVEESESLSTPAPDTSTDYAPPATITAVPLPASSTEGGSFSERIRNYRRFATLQRATARPLVYTKRTQPHASARSASTKAPSTTTASTTTTRSYLKRVAASRLRLSRLAAANRGASSAPAAENVDNVVHNNNNNNVQSSESGKKISVRNIDKELGSAKGYDSRPNAFDSDDSRNGVATWESVRNNLKRYQVNRKPGHAPHTTAAPAATSRATTRNALLRSPNRFANFKSLRSGKESLGGGTTTTSTTPAAPYIPPAAASTSPAPQQSTLQQHLTQTVSYDSPLSSSLSSSSAHTNHNNNNPNTLTSPNSVATSVSYSTSASSSSKNSPAAPSIPNSLTNAASSSISSELPAATFLSFDKLTRAIVDDSVLQNFQGNYRPSTSSTYQPVAASFGNAIASSVRPTTNAAALGFGQSQVQAPSQLTASQRPLVLPQVQPTTSLVPTAATPRVLIARAEGQRIEPNSVSSIISALVTQKPKTTHTKPYVPLEDFLTKEFGGSTVTQSHHKSTASTFYAQQQHQQYQSISTQNIQQQQQQQVVPTAATYQTSQQQAQQHYQKTTATVPTIFAQQPQQQQQQQQTQHHQQHQQQPQQQQQKQQYHQQHKQQQQTHSQQPQQQQHHHQQYKQQQFQQVATTATTFLAQQLQQQQLRQEQQYQRQQYQKQQLKQQQHFQQKQQYSNTQQQQQQQQYAQPQQQQYTQQAARQQQPTYYQTSTTTAKQQQQQKQLQQLPYLPPSQQIQRNDQQQQQQQQLQTQTLAPKYSYSQQQQQQYTPQQQHSTSQQQQQQLSSNITPNIFATFQQQQQLSQFPPLVSSAAPISPTAATLGQPTPTDLPPEHDVHLNVQLPALPNGLIPAPTTLAQPQTLQKRIDTATPTEYTQPSAPSTASTPAANSVYSGASSYEVPLSSIGRLPNDITQLLRRLRKL